MLVVLSYVKAVYVRSINEMPPTVCLVFLLVLLKLEIILFSFHCRVVRQQIVFIHRVHHAIP